MPHCMHKVQGLHGNPQQETRPNLDKKRARNKVQGINNRNITKTNPRPY